MRIGIISDTHGLLRPEVFDHFAAVDHILHAGDIGPAELLVELEALAPVTAVWGNTDSWDIRSRVPEVAQVELAGIDAVVVHGQQFGSPTPERVAAAYPDARIVVFGHSHKAMIRQVGATLAVNPGSAGRIRFGVTPTLAIAEISNGTCAAEVVTIVPRASPRRRDISPERE
jgi:putative phosphoesterase